MYISGGDSKAKSLRDQYTRRIQEQENLGKALRDKQKDIKQHHSSCMNQVRASSLHKQKNPSVSL